MKGLKKYSHEDREKVIKEIIPLIKKKFGKNLVALAAQGSYARNEDFAYSDLELIAFVYEMPENKEIDGMSKIREGLLVELVWMTKETYLEKVREVTENWYIAGSDILLPIINKEFIRNLNKYKVENLKEKCLNYAAEHWFQVQECTATALNAIEKKNMEGISLSIFDMFLYMLRFLSFLNQIPFTTLSQCISQAKTFKVKPQNFDNLIDIMIHGKYQDFSKLKQVVTNVFSEFENIFEMFGLDIYYDNVDPNKPMRKSI